MPVYAALTHNSDPPNTCQIISVIRVKKRELVLAGVKNDFHAQTPLEGIGNDTSRSIR